MLKCSRCGQYYVPGYLDCKCRMVARLPCAPVTPQLPSKEKMVLSAPTVNLARATPSGGDTQSSDNREARLT